MTASSIAAFDDPCHYQTAIQGAQVRVLPTAKGRFHAELMQVDLDRVWISRGRESLPRILEGAVDQSRATIVFPLAAHGFRHRGIEVAPGQLVFCDWAEAQSVSFAPCSWATVSMSPAELTAAGRNLIGRELAVPSTALVVEPDRGQMSELLAVHAAAAQLATIAPDRLARRRVARSLEASITKAMIGCLTEVGSVARLAGRRLHANIMKRFTDFVEANPNEPLHLAEICAAVGAPERLLRACCEEHLGMGPIRYLWLRRMHLAHQALLHHGPATATVTGIAIEFGFWELGRFSVQYRERFGELPSQTLRRPPCEPGAKARVFSFEEHRASA